MKHCLHEVKVNLITLLFSTILCLFSCSKEKVVSNSLEEERSLDGQEVLDRSPIRVREARDWFTTTYGQQKIITNANTLLSKDLQVVPVWAFAQTGTYLSDPIVICPILPPAHSDAMSRLFLVFTKASSNQVATQLVIFRALDGSWSSGAPLKLENFSGVIASLDLHGNYAGKVHFIIEGVQLGEIDPQPDGRGLVNDNGNTGNLATQQPWWSTEGSGSYWVSPLSLHADNGSSWHVNTGPHSTGSIYGTFTPIVSPPAGGGSVTGPPNTNPLDNHFQNLLANPLYTLEEYLYDNNIDAGVFEFLDTPAKIILANILPLIDPLNDFLKEQNHSNAAQIFVSDIIAQIGQNNLTAVTSSDLTALFPYSADVTAFLTAHPQNPQAQRALLTMANVSAQGWLTGPYPDSQRDAIIALYNFPDPEMYSEFILNCAYLKKQNPNRSNYLIGAEAYLMTISGYVHTLFDICGLVPLGGELCDLANGVLYVIEGDGVNATLSFAATIPVVGWVATGAKYAKVAVKITGTQTTKILKITHAGGGSLTFGARTTLRTVMNITDAANDAHHIIPWGKQSHSLVQHAAKADNIPYHMNHVKNGKEIKRFRFDQPDGIHANHPQYDANVEAKMAEVWQDLVDDFGGEANIPVNEASQRLRDLQNFIGSKIDANPNIKINDLQF